MNYEKENSAVEPQQNIQRKTNSVGKAIAILESFTPQHPMLSLTQLSTMLNIPKTTLVSTLHVLEEYGYVYKVTGTKNYHLGFKVMELSYNVQSTLSIVQYALPLMESLQMQTNEIIYLTSHINGRVFYLECVYPSRRAITYSVSGKTLPMHCTGCGKAMLAYLPESTVREMISQWGLPSFTTNTITDETALFSELQSIRERGYAIDNEEESYNVRCIAMPICDPSGHAVGALSISGSKVSMTDDAITRYSEPLATMCNALSQHSQLFPATILK